MSQNWSFEDLDDFDFFIKGQHQKTQDSKGREEYIDVPQEINSEDIEDQKFDMLKNEDSMGLNSNNFQIDSPSEDFSFEERSNIDANFGQTTRQSNYSIFQHLIFKEQRSNERKKNGNIPKFICRTMVKEFKLHKKIFDNDPILYKEASKMVGEEKRKYWENKNANNTLEDIERIFCDCQYSSNPKKQSFLMRKLMHKILRQSLREEVLGNSQIKLVKEYMIYLKAQSIRCRNKTLMGRLKAR